MDDEKIILWANDHRNVHTYKSKNTKMTNSLTIQKASDISCGSCDFQRIGTVDIEYIIFVWIIFRQFQLQMRSEEKHKIDDDTDKNSQQDCKNNCDYH